MTKGGLDWIQAVKTTGLGYLNQTKVSLDSTPQQIQLQLSIFLFSNSPNLWHAKADTGKP